MRTPKAKRILVDHYMDEETRETATMFLGPPGIGKSQGIYEASEEIANKLDRELVLYSDQVGKKILEGEDDKYFVLNSIPLVCHEPVDLTGVPRSNGHDLVEFKPLLWAKVMSMNPGILFLDDFLDVQRPDLFSAAYKVTLERRAGYYKLDDRVMVVCASNTPEESSLSQMMPLPLANRMSIQKISRPTVREWSNWMNVKYGDNWDKRTMAFLKCFEGEGFLLKMPNQTETLNNFPTPRTWTKVAVGLETHDEPEYVESLLGPEVGQKFHSFVQVNVDINELIRDPSLWSDQTLDGKYMLSIELANWLSQSDNPDEGIGLLNAMKEDSRQFPILVFLSLEEKTLSGLLNTLFKKDSDYQGLVSQTLEDREQIRAL